MTREQFRQLVDSQILVLDGATGTNLMSVGMPLGVCPEKWILEHPKKLIDLQTSFIEAGSNIVYAPTFTCNRIKLQEYHLESETVRMNKELVALSKDVIARNNSVDLIVAGIYKHFDINIDNDDVKAFAERIKNNVLNDKNGNLSNDTMKKMVEDDKTLQNIATSTLKRNLLFNELAALWDIRITDDDVKKSLDNYYQKTNSPIRDILNDKNKFESVRQIMLNERISIELLNRFKVKFNFPKQPDKKNN